MSGPTLSEVCEVFTSAEVPAAVLDTGGGCAAVLVTLDGRDYLLTDPERSGLWLLGADGWSDHSEDLGQFLFDSRLPVTAENLARAAVTKAAYYFGGAR